MRDSDTTTEQETTIDDARAGMFGDPVAYLATFGITAVVVAETTLPAAA